ncbi:hypothetical protein KKF34_03590 [Myxococcota bacterium]|nr:hypothetical protein [Myxococcota bacterium]MBU1382794.1 hypothetical protein [Myxococcota bacterium]MBU1495940.1 hypothetical protein [Myxococcota bacterium]
MKISFIFVLITSLTLFSCGKKEKTDSKTTESGDMKAGKVDMKEVPKTADPKDMKPDVKKPDVKKPVVPAPVVDNKVKVVPFSGKMKMEQDLKLPGKYQFMTLANDGTAFLWTGKKASKSLIVKGNEHNPVDPAYFLGAAFSPVSDLIAAWSGDTLYLITKVKVTKFFGKGCNKKCENPPCINLCPIIAHAAFSPDGKYLAYLSWFGDGTDNTQSLTVIETQTGRAVATNEYSVDEGSNGWVHFSADGTRVVTVINSNSKINVDLISVDGPKDSVTVNSGKPWTSEGKREHKLKCTECLETSGIFGDWYYAAFENDNKNAVVYYSISSGKSVEMTSQVVKDTSICKAALIGDFSFASHCKLAEYTVEKGARRMVRIPMDIILNDGKEAKKAGSGKFAVHPTGKHIFYNENNKLMVSDGKAATPLDAGTCKIDSMGISPDGAKLAILCSENNLKIFSLK